MAEAGKQQAAASRTVQTTQEPLWPGSTEKGSHAIKLSADQY